MKKRIIALLIVFVILSLIISGCGKNKDNNEKSICIYVLNESSLKFHYPDCSSALRMSDENIGFFRGYREILIEEGFSPCGNCKP